MALVRTVEGGFPMFWCVACKCGHGGQPGWTVSGPPDKPSIFPSYVCHCTHSGKDIRCHVVVSNGMLLYQPDSTHEYAGKQVPMEDF